jgi:kynurenine formamidase
LYGVDTLNADDFSDKGRPVHSVLLGADVAIVENLRGLGALHGKAFRFTTTPVKVEGCGSFPVRAWARTAE